MFVAWHLSGAYWKSNYRKIPAIYYSRRSVAFLTVTNTCQNGKSSICRFAASPQPFVRMYVPKNTIAAFCSVYRMPLLCFFGAHLRTNGCGDAARSLTLVLPRLVERHCALARAAHKTSQTLAVTPVGRGIGREIVSYGVCARLSAIWATVWPER